MGKRLHRRNGKILYRSNVSGFGKRFLTEKQVRTLRKTFPSIKFISIKKRK